jgi:hypothetical protein
MLPEFVENVIPDRFSKDICNLTIYGAILKLNKFIWICLGDDMFPKVMEFNCNVLGPRSKLMIFSHCNTRLIVLKKNLMMNHGEGKYNGKNLLISRIKVARGTVSLRAANKTIYSASAADKAISVCNLLCQ